MLFSAERGVAWGRCGKVYPNHTKILWHINWAKTTMNILQDISYASITVGFLCAIIIAINIIRDPQHMMIMNFVWPITALYAGLLGLLAYFTIGKKSSHSKMMAHAAMQHMKMPEKPFWQSVLTGTLHCGSGCTLGDILAEIILLAAPAALFGSTIYGSWVIDYICAFVIGIAFQYYAVKSMKKISTGKALLTAAKVDTLSLTAWQIGMYSGMAIATFLIFHHTLPASSPVFWFVMQLAMLMGFITSYPVNWWLINSGIKEKM
jgi:hypothetical protein